MAERQKANDRSPPFLGHPAKPVGANKSHLGPITSSAALRQPRSEGELFGERQVYFL
jgi:hypothetical protein